MQTNDAVRRVCAVFGLDSSSEFIIFCAVAIVAVFVLKGVVLSLLSFWQAKFVFEKKTELKSRLFLKYLSNPYLFHVKSDFSRLQRNLELVESSMNNVVLQFLYIVTDGVIVTALFGMLAISQPLLTVAAVLFFVLFFAVFHLLVKGHLRRWGVDSAEHRARALQQVNQGLGCVKDVKIFGKERFFAERFNRHSLAYAWPETKAELLSRLPRILIEVIVVAAVMAVVVGSFLMHGSAERVFSTVTLFAIIAVRLMPSLNRISAGMNSVRTYSVYLDQVYDDLVAAKGLSVSFASDKKLDPLSFEREIRLEDVVFSYEGSPKKAVDGVSLTIAKNAVVGFVGASGAGKTSVIDVLSGLITPSSGHVFVDGKDISDRVEAWQGSLGYIPQSICLFNDTILSNVAFGISAVDVDHDRVWEALRLAQLDDFVRALPDGLQTEVGERGIRLSGGQRQRIGIARALYRDPLVLIMDEATAALDNETEFAFMQAVSSLSGSKTIVIIAHRISTVKSCDTIFFMKDGRLCAEGNYDRLMSDCPAFVKMVDCGEITENGREKDVR
jgi:ATP-binding cassette subfamily C protein